MIKMYKYKNNIYGDDHFIQIDWSRRMTRKLYKDGLKGLWAGELILVFNLDDYVKKSLVELNKLELSILKAKGVIND